MAGLSAELGQERPRSAGVRRQIREEIFDWFGCRWRRRWQDRLPVGFRRPPPGTKIPDARKSTVQGHLLLQNGFDEVGWNRVCADGGARWGSAFGATRKLFAVVKRFHHRRRCGLSRAAR